MRKASPRNWWSLGGAEAIEAGEVAVSVRGANLGKATAEFTVPELPPGTYDLMLCDAGCTEPLADVIPTKGFAVASDPAAAQMAERVDGLERRLRSQPGRFARARRDAERALAAARTARSEVEELEAGVSSLAEESWSSPPVAHWASAGWLVAGALGGALTLLVLRRRRSRPSRPARGAGSYPSDEELQELLASSEPARGR